MVYIVYEENYKHKEIFSNYAWFYFFSKKGGQLDISLTLIVVSPIIPAQKKEIKLCRYMRWPCFV